MRAEDLIKAYNDGYAQGRIDTDMVEVTDQLRRDLKDCRNELCLRCGDYQNAHNGACDGCRFRDFGEWSRDLDE